MLSNAANRLVILQRAIQTPHLLPTASSNLAPLGLRSGLKTVGSRKLATVAVSADQSSSTSTTSSLPSISNIEAAWKEMSPQEQESIFHHLEGLQKKDWTQLSLDEKKASYWVSFGPHGPREPLHAPGSGIKLLLGITGCVSAAIALFVLIRSASPDLPRTMTKEWQEAATERAIEQKMDPFTGASAQGEKAKTFVQSK
ncbi:Cytochrome c oxidase subunit 5A [Puccinia graminis f. sp. tritici]|uniref:Cytochrome c oxidase subunit 5A n=1 Tax=Puccinia graminis f. sp. tritici TaxID=56615 RepID=A0A5B0RG03_PUCGR|nr:Cytochrome c oxidase subunit 5A [Puccinia graminis f. sp. tritici]